MSDGKVEAPGSYNILEVLDWTAGIGKANGTPWVRLGLRTSGGYINYISTFSDKTSERTVNDIMKLGFVGDGPEDFLNGKTNLFNVPSGITAKVEWNTYKDKTELKVTYINEPANDIDQIRDVLNAAGFNRFKTAYKARQQQRPTAQVAPKSDLDNVPF